MYKLTIIFSVIVIVSCSKPEDYCAQKYVRKCAEHINTRHAGCANLTSQVTAPYKLEKQERELLTKYFNDIRNEIASSKSIGNMNELKWSDEYEFLAKRAIELKSTNNLCFWTENSKVFPLELINIKIATNTLGNWTIKRIDGSSEIPTNPPFMNEVEFSRIKKINYLLDEVQGNSMQAVIHDPISNLVGCSMDIRHNATDDYKEIRCIVNARENYTINLFTGKPCTKCPEKSKCSKVFKNLCSSSDKLEISFLLMCSMAFLGYAKFIK